MSSTATSGETRASAARSPVGASRSFSCGRPASAGGSGRGRAGRRAAGRAAARSMPAPPARRAKAPPLAARVAGGPSSTTLPSSSTTTRSARRARSSECVMRIVVRPVARPRRLSARSLLGDRIEPGGRLVEQQDGRVAQQHAGDADPLPLAAGEPDAVGAEDRVVAVRQRADERVGAGRAGRVLDAVAVGVRGVGDVVGHRPAEQHGVLQQQRHLAAQPVERARPQVAAVDRDAARPRVVEPGDQGRERRLAGARCAHDRHELPGRHRGATRGRGRSRSPV